MLNSLTKTSGPIHVLVVNTILQVGLKKVPIHWGHIFAEAAVGVKQPVSFTRMLRIVQKKKIVHTKPGWKI